MRILGVDFTSAPRAAKPIVVAVAALQRSGLEISSVEALPDFASFERLLQEPGPWVGGFDFPFGLPRELVRDLGWPRKWRALVGLCGGLTRGEFRAILDVYRATRPAGRQYAHRRTDALMFQEGAPRLADAGVHVPGLAEGDRSRVALEAYPGLLARSILGRASYKNDSKAKQTPDRRAARARLVSTLELKTTPKIRSRLVEDATGDTVDAVLCAIQAARAMKKPRYGIPRSVGCEGWIVTA